MVEPEVKSPTVESSTTPNSADNNQIPSHPRRGRHRRTISRGLSLSEVRTLANEHQTIPTQAEVIVEDEPEGSPAAAEAAAEIAAATSLLPSKTKKSTNPLFVISRYCPLAVSLPVCLGTPPNRTSHTPSPQVVEAGRGSFSTRGFRDNNFNSSRKVVTQSPSTNTNVTLGDQNWKGEAKPHAQSTHTSLEDVDTASHRAVHNDFFGVVLLADISGFTRLAESLANGTLTTSPGGNTSSASAHSAVAGSGSTADPPSVSSSSHTSSSATLSQTFHSSSTNNSSNLSHSTNGSKTRSLRSHSEIATNQRSGADTTARIINSIFSKLIDVIREFDGDVVKFAGDAIISVWRPDSDQLSHRARSCLQACKASLLLQAEMKEFHEEHGIDISLHSALSCGTVTEVHFGGHQDRWEYVICGDPVTQLGPSLESARAGETVIHGTIFDTVTKFLTTEGINERDIWDVSPVGPDYFLERVDVHHSGDLKDMVSLLIEKLPSSRVKSVEKHMSSYIPRPVLAAINAGNAGLIGELRQVTILFINLPDFQYSSPGEIQKSQEGFIVIQESISTYDGTLRQFIQDDKGTVAIIAFGLPYSSHEDDPVRGVLAAITIRKGLQSLGMKCGIGVTTGNAYCGSVGNEIRCEYAIVGDCVNLSARLMSKSGMGILCDEETMKQSVSDRKTNHGVTFLPMDAIHVKGKSQPVSIFRPSFSDSYQTIDRPNKGIWGRHSELETLRRRIGALQSPNPAHPESWVDVVEAPAGMGKTRLVQECAVIAKEAGVRMLHGAGSSMTSAVPYGVWRNIVPTLLSENCAVDDDGQPVDIEWDGLTEFELGAFQLRMSHIDVADFNLMEIFTGIHFQVDEEGSSDNVNRGLPSNDKGNDNENLKGKSASRASGPLIPDARILEIIVNLLKLHYKKLGAFVLVIENLHCVDSFSRSVITTLARSSLADMNIHVLITCRPNATCSKYFSDTLESLCENYHHMKLSALGVADVSSLCEDELKVSICLCVYFLQNFLVSGLYLVRSTSLSTMQGRWRKGGWRKIIYSSTFTTPYVAASLPSFVFSPFYGLTHLSSFFVSCPCTDPWLSLSQTDRFFSIPPLRWKPSVCVGNHSIVSGRSRCGGSKFTDTIHGRRF